ncbi:hypothetical protein NHU_04117 [Rhodovulum sulfidophilum]|uniref:Uncharacterized protein n=1 Tax=Rhodovulum sulfidophilum TaxID=35806 RepID=A0A0D6B909_RHOSU|nr:hypothetical protein NHU_04117 [Rhodovulum sulfidophilum]
MRGQLSVRISLPRWRLAVAIVAVRVFAVVPAQIPARWVRGVGGWVARGVRVKRSRGKPRLLVGGWQATGDGSPPHSLPKGAKSAVVRPKE